MENPKTRLNWRVSSLFLSLVLLLFWANVRCSGPGSNGMTSSMANAGAGTTYSTQFPNTEIPISEGGRWNSAKAVSLDWADVVTVPGIAHGTQAGTGSFDDSTALLTGSWKPNQMAQATVHSVGQTDNSFEEVELRLRSSLSAHKATGYEINFRCSKTQNAYAQIVRWDGGLGKFTYITQMSGSQFGVTEGDVVKATIIGNVITAYINGVQVMQGTDSTFTSGNPGIGFFRSGADGVNSDFGFTSFTASDQL